MYLKALIIGPRTQLLIRFLFAVPGGQVREDSTERMVVVGKGDEITGNFGKC